MLRIISAVSAEDIQLRRNYSGYGKMPGMAPCLADFEREVSALPGPYAPPSGRLFLAFDPSEGNPDGLSVA